MREVVESSEVMSAVDDAESMWTRFDDAWSAVTWVLSRDPTVGSPLTEGGGSAHSSSTAPGHTTCRRSMSCTRLRKVRSSSRGCASDMLCPAQAEHEPLSDVSLMGLRPTQSKQLSWPWTLKGLCPFTPPKDWHPAKGLVLWNPLAFGSRVMVNGRLALSPAPAGPADCT